ncbi:hypothetical protein HK102_001054, partial [Quaeritorhiza haematococci]
MSNLMHGHGEGAGQDHDGNDAAIDIDFTGESITTNSIATPLNIVTNDSLANGDEDAALEFNPFRSHTPDPVVAPITVPDSPHRTSLENLMASDPINGKLPNPTTTTASILDMSFKRKAGMKRSLTPPSLLNRLGSLNASANASPASSSTSLDGGVGGGSGIGGQATAPLLRSGYNEDGFRNQGSSSSDWPYEGTGRRVAYANFTTIDWIHDFTKERMRIRGLRAIPGLYGKMLRIYDSSQGWVVVFIV